MARDSSGVVEVRVLISGREATGAAFGVVAAGVDDGVAVGCGAGDAAAGDAESAAGVDDTGCELTEDAGGCPDVTGLDWPAVCGVDCVTAGSCAAG